METIQLQIIDTDRQYLDALVTAIAEGHPGFSVHTYADVDDADEDYDIRLLGTSTLTQNPGTPSLLTQDKTILLCDLTREHVPEEWNAVHRYSSCSEILTRVRGVYLQTADKPPLPPPHDAYLTETVCIFGSGGGAGVSAIALTLARALSVFHHYSVLYISMESLESAKLCPLSKDMASINMALPASTKSHPLSKGIASINMALPASTKAHPLSKDIAGINMALPASTKAHPLSKGIASINMALLDPADSSPLPKGASGGVGTCLYTYFKGDTERFRRSVEMHLQRDQYGVMRFKPTSGTNPMYGLDTEQLDGFLQELKEILHPDFLLLDMDMNAANRTLRHFSNPVYLPIDLASGHKTHAAFHLPYILRSDKGQAPLRVFPVINRSERKPESEAFPEGVPEFLRGIGINYIPDDAESFRRSASGDIEIELSGTFGRAVYDLALRLIEEDPESAQ